MLTVEGRKTEKETSGYLYQGISSRSFRRQFNLADHVQVKSASVEDGLLQIELVREIPEAMKPRRIDIASGTAAKTTRRSGWRTPPTDPPAARAPQPWRGAPVLSSQQRRPCCAIRESN